MEIRFPRKAELRARFLRTLPGWLLWLLGAVFFVLSLKGTVEEAITTSGQAAHIVRIALPLLLSPWFGVILLLAGIVYVIFVPQKHHPKNAWIAPLVASIACTLTGLLLWSVVLMAITLHAPPI